MDTVVAMLCALFSGKKIIRNLREIVNERRCEFIHFSCCENYNFSFEVKFMAENLSYLTYSLIYLLTECFLSSIFQEAWFDLLKYLCVHSTIMALSWSHLIALFSLLTIWLLTTLLCRCNAQVQRYNKWAPRVAKIRSCQHSNYQSVFSRKNQCWATIV